MLGGRSILLIFAVVSLASEIYLTTTAAGPGSTSVFGSAYNWYHLFLFRH